MAEPNPAQDVEGRDTAAKLVIIANKLMNADLGLADVDIKGIVDLDKSFDVAGAKNAGGSIKLIGRAVRTDDGIKLSVAPEAIFQESPFFNLRGAVFHSDRTWRFARGLGRNGAALHAPGTAQENRRVFALE